MSTDSGIPDYRGPDSPPSNPMTISQFTSDPAFRQQYWARNHVGWRHMDETLPNAGHRALAELEHAGVVSGVITQNVDLLHTKAGSRVVVNLHGCYAQVICLDCGHTMSRAALGDELEAANPGFAERAEQLGNVPVLACMAQLRPALHRLIKTASPRLPVLAYAELGGQLQLETVGTVTATRAHAA